MSATDFVPRWASPPGDTIMDVLNEQHLDPHVLARALDLAGPEFDAFLAGDIPLTVRRAETLSSTIGGSVEFWMTRDGQYREDRSRVEADAWAQRLPVKDMASFGWIAGNPTDWVSRFESCLQFFDVAAPAVWEAELELLREKTRFRSSPSHRTDEYAVAAWLRQCEIELSRVPCKPWDREAFIDLLPDLRPLTRERDPHGFLPRLNSRCAEVGVAVGVVRAPRGCPVSGAARQLENGQPSIALSARHLADDHLWFTFFHEAAHLVIHGPDTLYIDALEPDSAEVLSTDETQADEFAGTLLIPTEYEDRLAAARQAPIELKTIADEIGVGLGIVIGHLQHRGVVGYKTRLNRLKNRYKWAGSTLETA